MLGSNAWQWPNIFKNDQQTSHWDFFLPFCKRMRNSGWLPHKLSILTDLIVVVILKNLTFIRVLINL